MGVSILYPLQRIDISYPRQQPRIFFCMWCFCVQGFVCDLLLPAETRLVRSGVGLAFHFAPNVTQALLQCKASGPDLENELPQQTQLKLDRSPQVLDFLSTLFPNVSGHFYWGRLGGLTCKMSFPTRPSKTRQIPSGVGLALHFSPKSPGRLSCGRQWGLTWKTSSPARHSKKWIDPSRY